MKFSPASAIFIRHCFLIKNNPTRLASLFLWLIISVVEWGFISKYLGTFGLSTFNYASAVMGAVILFEFTTRIQQGIMSFFLEDIWTQNIINYFASPLKVSEYVAGLVVSSIISALAGLAIMVAIAGLAFGYSLFKIGLLALAFIAILFVFGMAMGIFIIGIIFRFGPSAEWAGWPIPVVLSIFCGVFYPVATLPWFMQAVSAILPPSYVFESLRGLIGNVPAAHSLAYNFSVSAPLAIGYLFLAYRFFLSVYRRNLEHGTIARFNSEEL